MNEEEIKVFRKLNGIDCLEKEIQDLKITISQLIHHINTLQQNTYYSQYNQLIGKEDSLIKKLLGIK